MSVLNEIAEHKRLELRQKQHQQSFQELEAQAKPLPETIFINQLRQKHRRNLILEVKPASPSAGTLSSTLDLNTLLSVYSRYAAAISVLADQRYFQGSMALVSQVGEYCRQPILCKEFVLEPYQVLEARIAGAAAVLLIVKMLEDTQLQSLYQMIQAYGMTPVVEIQNETELERALPLNPEVLLVNNRNLDDLRLDLTTSERIIPLIPQPIVSISASGITSLEAVQRMTQYTNNLLIGTRLMQQF